MRPVFDPTGGPDVLVEKMIGTAYETVKRVYCHLPEIRRLDGVLTEIPILAQTSVDNALSVAMPPILAQMGEKVQAAEGWAGEAEASAEAAAQSAIEASKVSRMFPFFYNSNQLTYDVTVISGDPTVTTAGLALWVEGAIEYDFTILSGTLFRMNDISAYPDNAQMRIIVNARFDDLVQNFDQLQDSVEQTFLEFLASSNMEVPVAYAPGIAITRPTQTVSYEGRDYRVNLPYLPLTTTTWVSDYPKMVLISESTLRAELAAPNGSTKVGFERVFPLKSATSIGYVLSLQPINIYDAAFVELITDKPDLNDMGTWDWSPAIQAASDLIRARFNLYGPGIQNVIDFPGGRYRVKQQVVISAFVKLRSQGMVMFLTEVEGDSAFHFTPSAGDYSDNVTVVRKQQWFRGPFINGESGGFVWHNELAAAGCTAIELGPRTDLSVYTPFSRYSVCHFAVEGYAIGIKFNRFRNYIGTFDTVHLEGNTINVVFGDASGANVVDSGENIQFLNCVFAQSVTCFRWYCDGFDVNFSDCSFDYIGTIFWFSRLYKKITVAGGHMEGIGSFRAHDGIGGIVLEDSVHPADRGTICYVTITGVAGFIPAGQMIRGSSKLHATVDMDFRKWGSDNTPSGVFFCSPNVVLRRKNFVNQHRATYPSWSVNCLRNPLFAAEVTGASMYPTGPAGWKPVVSSFPAVISDDASSLGGKSIAVTGGTTGTYYSLDSLDKSPCVAGDVIQAGLFIKLAAGSVITDARINASIYFYDAAGALLYTTPTSLNDLGDSVLVAGQYCSHAYARQGVAPVGATHFTVRLGCSGAAMNNVVTHITGLYATILK